MTWQRAKTVCKHGHPFTADNTRIDVRTGRRSCIECGRIRSREFQRRKRATQLSAMNRGPAGVATASPSPSIGPREARS